VRQAIAGWSIWRQPPVVVALIVAMELTAIASPLYEPTPVKARDLATAALLASLSIAYSLLTRRFERARRALRHSIQPRTCPNLLSAWGIAAAILLPLPLASAVLVVAAVAEWPASNISGRGAPHKYVYSAAGTILAAVGTRLSLTLGLPHQVALPVAAVTYTAVSVLVIAAAVAGSGEFRALRAYVLPKTYTLDGLTAAIALAQVELHDIHLPLLWLSLPATIVLQRWTVRSDLQAAAADSGIKPMSEEAWRIAATEIVDALPVVSILRVTTDDQLAANVIAQMQTGIDAVGLIGDDGLAVLLLECPEVSADALARRVRLALDRGGVAANVAAATKPRDGLSMQALWTVCEAELITRDAANRSARPAEPET
jgi:hypothetical protein